VSPREWCACWGENYYGEVGVGDEWPRASPTRVGSATDWTFITTGANQAACGLRGTGDLYCWGGNGLSTLGDGTTTSRLTPTRIGVATGWTSVGVASHGCGVRAGELCCWGYSFAGQLGLGDTNNRNAPTRVGSAEDVAMCFHTTKDGNQGDVL